MLASHIVFDAWSMLLSDWPQKHTADWRSNVGNAALSAYTVAEHRLIPLYTTVSLTVPA